MYWPLCPSLSIMFSAFVPLLWAILWGLAQGGLEAWQLTTDSYYFVASDALI